MYLANEEYWLWEYYVVVSLKCNFGRDSSAVNNKIWKLPTNMLPKMIKKSLLLVAHPFDIQNIIFYPLIKINKVNLIGFGVLFTAVYPDFCTAWYRIFFYHIHDLFKVGWYYINVHTNK